MFPFLSERSQEIHRIIEWGGTPGELEPFAFKSEKEEINNREMIKFGYAS